MTATMTRARELPGGRHLDPITSDLRRARIAADLTQTDLARLLHVGPNTVSRWESGVTPLPLDMAVAYARIVGWELALRPAVTA